MRLKDISLKDYISAKKGFDEIERSKEIYEKEGEKGGNLLSKELLEEICNKYDLTGKNKERLFAALSRIEENEALSCLFKFLVWDLCKERYGEDGWFYICFEFVFDFPYPDCLKFILLLSCIGTREEKLKKRGVPEEYYENIPELMIKPQIENYKKTGSCNVLDFPWERNFYSGHIFRLDRFYFIPYKFEDPFMLYRNKENGEVTGVYNGGYKVSKDGQVISEESLLKEPSFVTDKKVEDGVITGNYMNTCGIISENKVSLLENEVRAALTPGDLLLALHIPGGEGYTPAKLKSSMELALSFYEKYFPEYDIKGFWSESWLYDPRLSLLLPESSNIVTVQRRFYRYSIGGNGAMLRREVWGSETADAANAPKETSLQKKAAKVIMSGNDFTTTSMIVLKEEVPFIEEKEPYIRERDVLEFNTVMSGIWKEKY